MIRGVSVKWLADYVTEHRQGIFSEMSTYNLCLFLKDAKRAEE